MPYESFLIRRNRGIVTNAIRITVHFLWPKKVFPQLQGVVMLPYPL